MLLKSPYCSSLIYQYRYAESWREELCPSTSIASRIVAYLLSLLAPSLGCVESLSIPCVACIDRLLSVFWNDGQRLCGTLLYGLSRPNPRTALPGQSRRRWLQLWTVLGPRERATSVSLFFSSIVVHMPYGMVIIVQYIIVYCLVFGMKYRLHIKINIVFFNQLNMFVFVRHMTTGVLLTFYKRWWTQSGISRQQGPLFPQLIIILLSLTIKRLLNMCSNMDFCIFAMSKYVCYTFKCSHTCTFFTLFRAITLFWRCLRQFFLLNEMYLLHTMHWTFDCGKYYLLRNAYTFVEFIIWSIIYPGTNTI